MLTWPHQGTNWAHILDEVTQLYEALVSVICDYADVVIAIREDLIDEVKARLAAMEIPLEYVYFYAVDCDDTWTRDHGPIAVQIQTEKTDDAQTEHGIKLLDFAFNGWGEKFPHSLDNQISRKLFAQGAFPAAEFETLDWVLEGGSIETDGCGTLLTTESCLLNKNRNPSLTKEAIEQRLRTAFGVRKINWLTSGFLEGDDTDGHIDTLARFCPNNTVVYTACDDEQDEHYASLKHMEEELQSMSNADGEAFHLLPLPWPGAKFNDEDKRLPATYANFLVVNEAVLVPIYDSISDEDALEVISQAFPGYEIFGIPCLSLIEHGGSLHCITMQLPEGVLMQS